MPPSPEHGEENSGMVFTSKHPISERPREPNRHWIWIAAELTRTPQPSTIVAMKKWKLLSMALAYHEPVIQMEQEIPAMLLGARYSVGQNEIGDWHALLAQLRNFWGPLLSPAPDTPYSLARMWLDHFDMKRANMHVDCCDEYGV